MEPMAAMIEEPTTSVPFPATRGLAALQMAWNALIFGLALVPAVLEAETLAAWFPPQPTMVHYHRTVERRCPYSEDRDVPIHLQFDPAGGRCDLLVPGSCMLRKDGRWIATTHTLTDAYFVGWVPTRFGAAEPATITSSLSASGILTDFIDARVPFPFDGRVTQQQTLDLNTGKFSIHGVVVSTSLSFNCYPEVVETVIATTDASGVIPLELLPMAPTTMLGFTNPFAETIGAVPAPVDPTVAAMAPGAGALAADGVSAAVAVYNSPSSAPVTFSLHADSPAALSPYDASFLSNPQPGVASQVTVQPAFCTNECTFLALVWAPQAMPASASDRASRLFIAEVTATQSGDSAQSELRVVPPPLAMVHGLWSDSGAWAPFVKWLWARYPHGLVRLVDYEADNFRAFSDPAIQSSLRSAVADLLSTAANEGVVARRVDMVGHSMGGLAARWFASNLPLEFPGSVNRLITIGTPHQGSELARQLWLNRNSAPAPATGAGALAICALKGILPCSLSNLMASFNNRVDAGVESLQPTSSELNQLGNFGHLSIAGQATAFSATEYWLNWLFIGAFAPGTSVSSALGPLNDTIVSTASQTALAADASIVNDVVHRPLISNEIGETASVAVWNQILYWLMGGTGSPVFNASSVMNLGAAGGNQAASGLSVFDLTGKTSLPATNVTFTPASDTPLGANLPVVISAASSTRTIVGVLLVQTGGAPDDIPVRYVVEAPFSLTFTPVALGSAEFIAFVVFSDDTYAATALRYPIQPSGSLDFLTLSNVPVASLPVGTATTVHTTAWYSTGPVDVTSTAAYAMRGGAYSVFSVDAGGLLTATGTGSDWLDVTYGGKTLSALLRGGDVRGGGSYNTLSPCRILDTRNPDGPLGGPAIAAFLSRRFTLSGVCGVPQGALVVAANVTVTGAVTGGHLTLFPSDRPAPATSTINFSAGQTRANNAMLLLDPTGSMTVQSAAAGPVHVIVDVVGFFQ